MDKEHLNFNEILSFVCSDRTSFSKSPEKYFDFVKHFSECEKCREIKNDLCRIQQSMEDAIQFLKNDDMVKLKAKITYSLDKLQLPQKKYNDIFFAVKGTLSNTADNSKFYLEQENQHLLFGNFDYVTMNREDGTTKKYFNMISDDKLNKITLDAGNISVSLSDDGKNKHSVLLIPESMDREPIIQKLKKEEAGWKAECICPEDDYDIVIF